MSLWDIWEIVKTVANLADDLKEYHAEIKEIRRDIHRITLQIQRISDEIELVKQRTASEIENIRQRAGSERENMELRLRVWQLEFEKKQLPPPRDEEDETEDQ